MTTNGGTLSYQMVLREVRYDELLNQAASRQLSTRVSTFSISTGRL